MVVWAGQSGPAPVCRQVTAVAFLDRLSSSPVKPLRRAPQAEAEQEWASWLQTSRDALVRWPPVDRKGPQQELRLWVKTADELSFNNRVSREKRIDFREKDRKAENVSEQEFSMLAKRMQQDHSNIGGFALGSFEDAYLSCPVRLGAGLGGKPKEYQSCPLV